MTGIDPAACKFALSKIEDGFVFENFAQSFLAPVLGQSFLPVGGIKDKGIDGLNHIFSAAGNNKVIYQYSIEKDPEGKSDRTLKLFKENNIGSSWN